MTSVAKTTLEPDVSLLVNGQTADATDVTPAITNLRDYVRAGRVGVTDADTHVGTLSDKLTAGSGLAFTTLNPGANEQRQLALSAALAALNALLPSSGKIRVVAIDSEAATNGQVLTANGSGGASFAAAGGGGAQPIDLTATAGEDLALRDMVFLDEADGKWYKIDVDVTPIKCGRLRGCVNAAGGILTNNTGSVRILGEVAGFTSLTAWARVYAATTAGGITQTRPSPSAGGAQVAIAELGVAVSATAILINPLAAMYMKRANLADGAALSVEHHPDAAGHKRDPRAYISKTIAGQTLATYASSNQDVSVWVRGPNGAGGNVSIEASASTSLFIGDSAGTDTRVAQSFQVSAGRLSQIDLPLKANAGSPTGNITWAVHADNGGIPGTVLATGSFTPVQSANNVISVADGPFLQASTTYWVSFEAALQGSNNRYEANYNASGSYANGQLKWDETTGGSFPGTWANGGGTNDMRVIVTTMAETTKDRLAQSAQPASTALVASVKLWLKKIGSPTGNLTVKIMSDSSGSPSGSPITNGTSNTVAASTLASSYGWIEFTFGTAPSVTSGTKYWLVLETADTASNTNYVGWGADASSPSYASNEMKSEASSTWSAENKDACFEFLGQATTFQEVATIGRWDAGTRDIGVRFDDGTGGSVNTKTTFKNTSGATADFTAVVEVV